MILPVFVHGLYDFLQFLLSDGYLAIVGFALGVLIVFFSYLYVRKRECNAIHADARARAPLIPIEPRPRAGGATIELTVACMVAFVPYRRPHPHQILP